MKFDYVIGNPPYQDDIAGEQRTYSPNERNSFSHRRSSLILTRQESQLSPSSPGTAY